MDKFPLAASGWFYLLPALFMALVASALGVWWLAVPLWLAAGFVAYFFRDPARSCQAGENAVISPADGKVVVAEEVDMPELPGGRALLVSIFMNLFSVHVNRVPMSGQVENVLYTKGDFMPADRRLAAEQNERMSVRIAGPGGGTIQVTQVAGLVARRIECRLAPGDEAVRGKRYGMIRFGSRLDVYLPPEAALVVALGQQVRAGVTVLAEVE